MADEGQGVGKGYDGIGVAVGQRVRCRSFGGGFEWLEVLARRGGAKDSEDGGVGRGVDDAVNLGGGEPRDAGGQVGVDGRGLEAAHEGDVGGGVASPEEE